MQDQGAPHSLTSPSSTPPGPALARFRHAPIRTAHHRRRTRALRLPESSLRCDTGSKSATCTRFATRVNRLTPDDLDRLIKLLGMLGSAHDGERAAAGLKAHEFIRRHGLCWADVIRAPIGIERGGDDHHADGVNWRHQRDFCLRHTDRLTAKELRFLINIGTWRGPLTEKQQVWIDGIYARLRREAA